MRKIARLLPVALIGLLSCNSADNKVPQIAADFCNCFASVEKDLSAGTIDVLTKASNADNPEQALQDEIKKLDEETQMKIGTEMMALGEVEDPKSELGRCIKDVEKKYGKAYTLNQKKFGEKIIKELEAKSGCKLTAAIMKLGLKMEDKK
jgi:hypothetical protein